MLLQEIVSQLDGELIRLKSLRSVVAGLAKSPTAIRGLKPKLERLLQVKPPLPKANPAQTVTVELSTAPAEPVAIAERGHRRGRPRGARAAIAAMDGSAETLVRTHRRMKVAEPTALGKAASTGPVVISAAALMREREARMAVKAGTASQSPREMEPEVRPEVVARQLAARWLLSPDKA